MVGKFGKNPGSNQLRWVILLLAIAVILPTVCLLWFMSQAVRNERLAVRQKLIDVYTEKAKPSFVEYPDLYWQEAQASLDSSKGVLSKRPLLFPDIYAGGRFSGFVIFGEDGKTVWPILQVTNAGDSASGQLQKGAELEFGRGGAAEALAEYRRVVNDSNDAAVRLAAQMAEVRCLVRLNRTKEAIGKCRDLSYPEVDEQGSYQFAADVMRMRVRLAQLYRDSNDPNLYEHLRRCLAGAGYEGKQNTSQMTFPSSVDIWGLQQLADVAQQTGLSDRLDPEIQSAKQRISLEKVSSAAAAVYSNNDLVGWPEGTVRRLNLPQSPYGVYYRISGKALLCLMSEGQIKEFAGKAANDWTDDTVACRVLDERGGFVAGAETAEGKAFGSTAMGRFLPGWTAQLYFRDLGVFDTAASRQTAIYMWTGVLVILLIVVCGAVAAQSVGKQIRLNRLKNDFIATVTHELRTPLASMRVLVDTLLEGNYHGEATVGEYLRLVSKENERLSRLIDNFLGFSRMERNKRAFEMRLVSPVEIANFAADAVRGKFDGANVKFEVKMSKPLPMVEADQDAMVTVLVNLLENAYKYSGENKSIQLRVYAENGSVCFAVEDNGIGIPRRAMGRIFKRFYQVDSSLSRRAEGCGLGLSIVKFIVEAHKGQIDVKSEVGKGSVFTVRLAAERIGQ
jgi:signal transduction histidine kinase